MNVHHIPIFFLLLLSSFCKSDDQLTRAKPLTHGDTLISKSGNFALGFFSTTSSNKSFYLGIWYHSIPGPRTVVWVANRDNAITTPSSTMLSITTSSDLVLSDSKGHAIWRATSSITTGGAEAYALLLNSGNFVLRLPNSTDAHAVERLIAWKGPDQSSLGIFSCGGDPSSPTLQRLIWHGTTPYSRSNLVNGVSVSGGTYLSNASSIVYETNIKLGDEFYYMFTVSDVLFERPKAACDVYASCGPFSYCDLTSTVPACKCFDGFEPDSLNFSSGCRRTEDLNCGKQSQFITLSGMKVPDKFLHLKNRSFDECAAECSNNCSCTAYAYANLSSGGANDDPTRCLVWTRELIDTGKSTNSGENLYLRLAESPVDNSSPLKVLLPIIALLLLLTCIVLIWTYKFRGKSTEFPFISYKEILSATNFFADSNLLGRGDFGKVYKGTMEGGYEVAVKRLSQGSGQGIVEFKNEVVLIAKLQHKNLVRLHGCCIQEDEKLLIYEYLPNKSLDAFLFDFGMARIFGANQNHANTTRVVGTYGYMSPEYAMGGAFSVKTDTYSFGVLLLEIVSGLKISSLELKTNFCSLICQAWRLWEVGEATELVDSSIVVNCSLHEVLRCVHIGLLCVQDHPNDRPLMSSVMLMLENGNTLLPTPKQPAYFALSNREGQEATDNMENSINAISITALEGR
ncbi:G-type lectin S-receptor-like serine/threonine-protein kinase At1g11330 [Triticum dicoccoides]|uniref:G-type lectin S-receptor-like serine/threonine-protein kinase At1g11330 n=1 Tax=Triticum dicoccoides TaxID=85692 RepID=UPI0018918D84|nr:G-type lectin S-receptor-like serine/threonine-protein kinase At1g11330 [Triticum dicoccoides]